MIIGVVVDAVDPFAGLVIRGGLVGVKAAASDAHAYKPPSVAPRARVRWVFMMVWFGRGFSCCESWQFFAACT
jgi:hypothetical protein